MGLGALSLRAQRVPASAPWLPLGATAFVLSTPERESAWLCGRGSVSYATEQGKFDSQFALWPLWLLLLESLP